MRAPVKLLLWLIAGMSTLVAVLMALLLFIEVDVYRGQIQRHVSTAFGRDIVLEGSLSLEPSLTPRFVVNGLKIANPDWASRPFLATADKFDIRVKLLPLLRGDLEIVALEFHGIDLLLEKAPDGSNNFTFGASAEPAALPAIERMSLYDATIAYAAAEGPVRRLHMAQVRARKVPGQPVELEAQTTVNAVPVALSLRGKPLGDGYAHDPWEITLLGEAGDLSLRVQGRVADPTDWRQGEYRLALKGRQLNQLETLSGYPFPEAGPYKLAAKFLFKLDDYLAVSDFSAQLGDSDLHGNLRWNMKPPRPAIKVRLESQHLDAGYTGIVKALTGDAGQSNTAYWDQPLELGIPGSIDLDINIQIQRLDGLAKSLQDIVLVANADRQRLKVAALKATVDGTQIDASAALPWGEHLAALAPEAASLKTLLQHAEFDIHAQAADAAYHYATKLMGRPLDLLLTSVEATARPGTALTIRAEAAVNDKPVTVQLQGEPLTALLQSPGGPWQALALEARGDDIRLNATGSVARPLAATGFDIRYQLSTAEINTLLPLQGAFSLSGHYADQPDRHLFDELNIRAGGSDIGGRISVYQGQPRPRVVANLNSEQIYLDKRLPGSDMEAAAGAERRLIPDYNLPIERMREIDGELTFKGKRLRTAVGDLGDISFAATLKDGVFRLDPFQVHGWAGALIESDGVNDASRDPPIVEWNWIARQLSHGVLLKQAGFAETVEGTLDITLRLSGSGRSRHEFLGAATGQLIIVGQEGRFGSRRLDLWGSDLVTTMLSREWHRDDVTDLNCLIARIGIEDGVASSDDLLVDTRRITIAASGTLDLASEELNLVFAPRPKRTSLVSLTSPVRVTGTLAAPEVEVAVLPRRRMAAAGTGALAGLVNPGYLLFTFTQTGSRQANPCAAAVEAAMAMKGIRDETDNSTNEAPARFSLLPGCTPSAQRPGP